MIQFLTTTGISFNLEAIIKEAKNELYIITPYLKISQNFYERLKDSNNNNVEITLIYGKSELSPQQKFLLEDLENLNLVFHKNLHAKCYFNEEKALVTSMNLHEYSEKNNREMGFLIDKFEENLFEEIMKEVSSIFSSSVFEKKSKKTQVSGFFSDLIEYSASNFNDYAKMFNELFKRECFKVKKFRDFGGNLKEELIAENFNKGVDIVINERIEFHLKFEKDFLEIFHPLLSPELNNCGINENYRLYWDYFSKPISVYKSLYHRDNWENLTREQKLNYYKRAIEIVSEKIGKIFSLYVGETSKNPSSLYLKN
jgi:hypothetical protein